MPLPRLSNEEGAPVDDWTHFLIWEAVMDRFDAMRRVAEADVERKAAAKRKAGELLAMHRGETTGG